MKYAEKVTPLAAALSAIVSLFCCLPLAIPAALGAAGLGVMLSSLQPVLLALAAALLVLGFVQLYRRRACGRPGRASVALLAVATVVVCVAAFGIPALRANNVTELNAEAFTGFREDFNRASDSTRVVVLLSPT